MMNDRMEIAFKDFFDKNPSLIYSSLEEMMSAYEATIEDFSDEKKIYNWDISEYDFDLLVRTNLEEFIKYINADISVTNSVQYKVFLDKLKSLDKKFVTISFEVESIQSEYWWERRILKKAGPRYAEDVKTFFGKEIEVYK